MIGIVEKMWESCGVMGKKIRKKYKERVTINEEFYNRLVAAFEIHPGAPVEAAKIVGCTAPTARKGWHHGWPEHPWGRPIKDYFNDIYRNTEEKKRRIRHEISLVRDDEYERQMVKLRKAVEEEDRMLVSARNDVLGALSMAATLTPAMERLANTVAKKIDKGAARIKPADALNLLNRHAHLLQRSVDAADRIVKLARIHRGEAGEIVGIKSQVGPDLSFDESIEVLEGAGDLLNAIREREASGGKILVDVKVDDSDDNDA